MDSHKSTDISVSQKILPAEYSYHFCDVESKENGFQAEFCLAVEDAEGAKNGLQPSKHPAKKHTECRRRNHWMVG